MPKTTLQLPAAIAETRAEVPSSNEVRREQGRQHMSAVMIHWLALNDWSHPNFEDLATWALNEKGNLHTSQVSHMRNGKMRMMGVKVLDSFGAINLAVWAYNTGQRDLLTRMGVATIDTKIEKLIKGKQAIMNPLAPKLPLDQGDWMDLYLGYLQIPGVIGGAKGEGALEQVALKLGKYVYGVVQGSGKDFVEAREVFTKSLDSKSAEKLIACAVGLDSYASDELTTELAKICQALERLDGKPRTPEVVAAELA